MLKTFDKFQELLNQTQARMGVLHEEVAKLSGEWVAKQRRFDEAILEGADPEELQAELDALEKKTKLKQREYDALEAAADGKAKTGKIHEAARAVWNEGVKIITEDFRAEWEAGIIELEKAKADFLIAVAKLGAIKRLADEMTRKLHFGLEGFLPSAGAPRLATGIYEEKHKGIIFPDYREIMMVYQQRRK